MDRDEFWRIVDAARSGAVDDDEFLEAVESRLRTLKPEELVEFEGHFTELRAASYSRDLWGAAYLMNGGCSDDGFEDFRAWLIAQGRETFERALQDPDTLATLSNPEGSLEDFLYVASGLYEDETGAEMPDSVLIFQGMGPPDLGEGWDFDDAAEMKKRYPKLFAMYGSA
jgi:Protein of unknown function (DUF4240)